MILEMKVPSPGESISEVEIAQWLVSNGDYVEKDQTIAEVDSDKATLDLPAEESGTITLKAAEGDTVAVGDIVCLINTSVKKPVKLNSIENRIPSLFQFFLSSLLLFFIFLRITNNLIELLPTSIIATFSLFRIVLDCIISFAVAMRMLADENEVCFMMR